MFSKDGTPSFSCSAKPKTVTDWIPEDFLWLDDIDCYASSPGSPESWWSTLDAPAERNRSQWNKIQWAMAKFCCSVEVKSKPGVGWVEVPAIEAGGQTTRAGSGLRFEVPNN